MGAENFRVAIDSPLPVVKATEQLLSVSSTIQVESDIPDTRQLQMRGAGFLFEIDVWPVDGLSRVTFSMTVCHPLTALKEFISAVNQNAVLLNSNSVSIMEDLPGGVVGDFHNGDFSGFPEAISSGFALKRDLWRAEFGIEEAVVTARDALRRFVLG